MTESTSPTRSTRVALCITCLDYDYVVVPSGSCTSMLRLFYPELFADDPSRGLPGEDRHPAFVAQFASSIG